MIGNRTPAKTPVLIEITYIHSTPICRISRAFYTKQQGQVWLIIVYNVRQLRAPNSDRSLACILYTVYMYVYSIYVDKISLIALICIVSLHWNYTIPSIVRQIYWLHSRDFDECQFICEAVKQGTEKSACSRPDVYWQTAWLQYKITQINK